MPSLPRRKRANAALQRCRLSIASGAIDCKHRLAVMQSDRQPTVSYYTSRMSMGKRKAESLASHVGDDDGPADRRESPFYRRLNELLREHGFDDSSKRSVLGAHLNADTTPLA